jgi:PAS domain S-box-containing protein
MQALFAHPTLHDLALRAQFSALHAALEGIVTFDAAMRIVMINPAAQRMFGLTVNEALGRDLSTLIPERLRAAHAAHVRQFAQSDVIERRWVRAANSSVCGPTARSFPWKPPSAR